MGKSSSHLPFILRIEWKLSKWFLPLHFNYFSLILHGFLSIFSQSLSCKVYSSSKILSSLQTFSTLLTAFSSDFPLWHHSFPFFNCYFSINSSVPSSSTNFHIFFTKISLFFHKKFTFCNNISFAIYHLLILFLFSFVYFIVFWCLFSINCWLKFEPCTLFSLYLPLSLCMCVYVRVLLFFTHHFHSRWKTLVENCCRWNLQINRKSPKYFRRFSLFVYRL